MTRSKLQILVAALLVALCSTALSAASLSTAEIAAMVAAHNAVRQRVAQAESLRLGGTVSIPDLTWDPTTAAVAQEWADLLINQNPPETCHRCGVNACTPPLVLNQCIPNLGESIYWAWSTGTPDQSASTAVESWASEQQHYNFDLNTCASGKVCGHYTQVVWSSTQRLGCGRAVRTTTDGRTHVIWVCNYAPPGNMMGQRPYSVTRGGGVDLAGAWNDGGLLSTAVYLSDGARFPGWTQWSVRDGGWIDPPAAKWAAGDFNGDGKTDLVAIWNNGGQNTLTVSQSTGSSFTRSHWATNAGGWSDTAAWCAGQFQ